MVYIDERPGVRQGVLRLQDEHVLGVTRMAVMVVNGHGKLTHWSRTAEDLFGASSCLAVGKSLRALLRLPKELREAFDTSRGRVAQAWAGSCLVPRVDDGAQMDVAWWVYPLAGPAGARLIAVAADARRIRDHGPGFALGDTLLAAPPAAPLTRKDGMRVLRMEPTLLDAADLDTALLGRRLTEILPPMEADVAEQIVRQILARGYPATNISVTVRLPFASFAGALPATWPDLGRRSQGLVPRARRGAAADADVTAGAREHLAVLSEASARVGDSLDPVQTAQQLSDSLVPRFADFAAIHVAERIVSDYELPAGPPEDTIGVALSHDDDLGRWDDVMPIGEVLRLPSNTPFVQSMRSGTTIGIGRVGASDAAAIADQFTNRDLRPLLEGRSLLVTPLIARGTVFGTLILLRKPDRAPFDSADIRVVEELARRTAISMDNGRLYKREARAVQELQRTMLPATPPVVTGAQICYRYVPASQTAHVGGDWFDAIPLPGGRLALVVGDVMGHGLTSAAIMGQLRTAVRTLAAQDLPPDHVLRQLDDLAQRLGEECIATCFYAVYDPVARICEIASAGHLPPVLITPYGQGRLLRVPAGAPIGVGGVPFETVAFDVPDDSSLVVCTDGLVERRHRDIEAGLVALRDHLSGPVQPLEMLCEVLITDLEDLEGGDRPDDDVALLAVRFEGIPKDDVVSWTFAAEASMVARTRAMAREALDRWGLLELTPTVELLVSELVTNAFLHGGGDIDLRMIKATSLVCEVRDDGHDLPHLCHAEGMDESGRGLQLVSHLAERWGTHRTPTGKVVWFELAVSPLDEIVR